MSPEYGIAMPSPLPPTSDITYTTRSHRLGQSQQYPASCTPSLQHLRHTNPAAYVGYDVDSPRCDGPHTVSGGGVATDGNDHLSFGRLDPATSSQSNAENGARGSFPSQCLQYGGQHRAPPEERPIPEADNRFEDEARGLRSDAGFSTDAINYFLTYPESEGVFTRQASALYPDKGSTTGAMDYFLTYPEANDVFTGEASGLHPGMGSTADAMDYFLTYPEANDVLIDEASD
jgi:hypothetical protein